MGIEIDAKDLYEQLGRLAGAQEQTNLRMSEIGDRLGRLPCAGHLERLERIEKRLEVTLPEARRPPSSGYQAVIGQLNERLQRAEDEAHESLGEVTDRIRLDAIAAAKSEALVALKQLEKEKEEAGERRAIRWQRWLQIASTVLAILGGSGIVASVRFMYGAEDKMAQQVEATKRQRVVYIHRKPDAAIEP